jgi:hypothetical protein
MTVGEYEERFRRPASSKHLILMAEQSPIQPRRRRRRSLVAAALLAVTTLFQGAANRHFRPAAEDLDRQDPEIRAARARQRARLTMK